jgi:flagellar basal body-associated protein FliL
MKDNKKKITYIIIAVVAVIIITASTVGALILLNGNKSKTNTNTNSSSTNTNTNTSKTNTPATKATATSLRTQALAAITKNDMAKAKTLLLQAKQQYTELKIADGLADIDALLYYVNNTKTPVVTKPPVHTVDGRL